MGKSIELDIDKIYQAWRTYLLAHSQAKYFGMLFDSTKQAHFPYANLRLVSRYTDGSDLDGDESSIYLTFETEAYINNSKLLTLYNIDTASADFFLELGFRRTGDSQVMRVSDTVTKITSRFLLRHYCGYFLVDLDEIIGTPELEIDTTSPSELVP